MLGLAKQMQNIVNLMERAPLKMISQKQQVKAM
jgi:hypothetical protein